MICGGGVLYSGLFGVLALLVLEGGEGKGKEWRSNSGDSRCGRDEWRAGVKSTLFPMVAFKEGGGERFFV